LGDKSDVDFNDAAAFVLTAFVQNDGPGRKT